MTVMHCNSSPPVYCLPVCSSPTHLWKGLELGEVLNEAEELEGDAGGNDEQAHGEQDEATQFPARSKDLTNTHKA